MPHVFDDIPKIILISEADYHLSFHVGTNFLNLLHLYDFIYIFPFLEDNKI